MHGLINRAIERFARDTYGVDRWAEVVRRAELDVTEFEAMMTYPDETAEQVIAALSAVLDKPRPDLLEDIGTYLVSHPGVGTVRRLLRFGGVDFEEFLHSLDELPERARLAVPDLGVACLDLHEHGAGAFSLACTGPFHGFGHVVVGLLRAMADDYGALVVIDYKGARGMAEIIEIRLLDPGFVEGRAFELGGEGGRAMTETSSEITAILDRLCPMHARLNATGHIVHAGPTLSKLRPDFTLPGMRFLELVELRRPRGDGSMRALMAAAGRKLHLRFRDRPRTQLKGVLAPLPGGEGAVVDLSLGISMVESVRDYALTSADFAATDLTVEMLYLVEANSAAMDASRKLNLRLQGARIAAEEQAFTDTLTGLRNRRALDCVLERMIASERQFALMTLDLDFFKAVNDRLGHAAGDHVLQEVARRMVEETRGEDIAARVGGDEFLLLLDGLGDPVRLSDIARRMIARLEEPIPFESETCRISASIGATLSHAYTTPREAEMLADADRALYAAKEAGRGCHALHGGSALE